MNKDIKQKECGKIHFEWTHGDIYKISQGENTIYIETSTIKKLAKLVTPEEVQNG